MILDGKIVSADRCHVKTVSRTGRDIDLWYSGKSKDFGGNIQGLFYPGGRRCGSLACCARVGRQAGGLAAAAL